jgi:HSP20 family protein
MFDRFNFDPKTDLKNYREALRQMLEEGWALPRDLMPSPLNAVVIPIDVLDNGTEIVIKANLPGVKSEDVSVSILNGVLTIQATLGEDVELRGATYLRRERRADSFTRSLKIPGSVDPNQADARFKNGVLTLTLRKTPGLRQRVINVDPE